MCVFLFVVCVLLACLCVWFVVCVCCCLICVVMCCPALVFVSGGCTYIYTCIHVYGAVCLYVFVFVFVFVLCVLCCSCVVPFVVKGAFGCYLLSCWCDVSIGLFCLCVSIWFIVAIV